MMKTFTIQTQPGTKKLNNLLPLIIFFLFFLNPLTAQTTWTGTNGTDWADAGNWSAGVPDAADDVTMPNVTNDPTIGAGTMALARTLDVQSGGALTVAATGSLAIDHTTGNAFTNNGTVDNNGTITVGGAASSNFFQGIDNQSTFNNNAGGQIHIDRVSTILVGAIRNSMGTFTNAGTITTGATAPAGVVGISTGGGSTFNNNAGGQIHIDRSNSAAIENTATFNNAGTITIGASANVGDSGIANLETFNNNTGGQIHINRANTNGIHAQFGTFINQGAITIGQLTPITNLVNDDFGGAFSNSTGGSLNGTGTVDAAIFTHAGGTLSPGYSPGTMTFDANEDFSNSTLNMEVDGTSGAGVAGGHDQIVVSGTATIGGGTTLNLAFGYAAQVNDFFDIVSATTVSGTFGAPNISNSGSGNVNTVTLSYVGGNTVRATVSAILPVELVGFSAKERGGQVALEWQTASEMDNKGFDIERSVDGKDWQAIGFVEGQGTTLDAQSYSFEDERPLSPHLGSCKGGCMNFYRLRQMDFDGGAEYSKVVSIALTTFGKLSTLGLYPSPASRGSLSVTFSSEIEEATLTLFGPSGQMVSRQKVSGGQAQLDLSHLPEGLYLVHLTDGTSSWRERVVVQ